MGAEANDEGTVANASTPERDHITVSSSRMSTVGNLSVRRALPQRDLRTVGAWCFADHMGPMDVTEKIGLDVGPHPHMGIQTVTWLVEGEALHRDSLGTEQLLRPHQLNLMTAGRGVAHSEEATGRYRGALQGVQLWIAQPDATRNAAPAFEHHRELPQKELGGCTATVLVGDFAGLESPARHDSPLVGIDLEAHGTSTFSLQPEFEYALIVLEGSSSLNGLALEAGNLAYVPTGYDEITLVPQTPTRALVLGGVPIGEPILMWWNFVARSRAEIDEAFESWTNDDSRFGIVASTLARVGGVVPSWHASRVASASQKANVSEWRVTNNVGRQRYEISSDAAAAGFAEYDVADDIVSFTHTFTQPSHGGKGLATKLVRFALDDAKAQGLGVLPYCWFVAKVIAEHPDDYMALVPPDRRADFNL